jgi:hypothetical protein
MLTLDETVRALERVRRAASSDAVLSRAQLEELAVKATSCKPNEWLALYADAVRVLTPSNVPVEVHAVKRQIIWEAPGCIRVVIQVINSSDGTTDGAIQSFWLAESVWQDPGYAWLLHLMAGERPDPQQRRTEVVHLAAAVARWTALEPSVSEYTIGEALKQMAIGDTGTYLDNVWNHIHRQAAIVGNRDDFWRRAVETHRPTD